MKQKILKESIDLFDAKGFKETSIQDIVDKIGVTKGTFYYYFDSKQEVLRDIHLAYLEGLLEEQQVIYKDNQSTYKDKLFKVIYLINSKIETKGKDARIVFREMRHLNENHVNQIKQKRKEFRIIFEQILDEGKKAEEFKDNIRTDILAFAILGMLNRNYYWFKPDGEISDYELSELYMEMILSGINKD
ncbi:TetR/AcrR family transcriptional regulator [Cytobacillus purgationiresistens]|uniref:AcrR family transcriptional regulator n=1 Tax=Cytobacillus purgationiresistens TaxID=863449 RepID=A0ABU0AH80_9BACI|nr:TetR/AcrR family transcriptional regulator [Cytobacillus purgationiresistens]MDQ0269778.1 AcrR family transcriptional regulator [Cytobacillus purgationiresistens]